jgi:hypothetical protein
VRAVLSSFAQSARVFRDIFGNPAQIRVELAFVSSTAAEWGSWVAMLVFAYH